jgi:hypothetical protein
MHIRIITERKYHYPSLGLVTKVRTTKGEWVEKMFWDSSTLPQVWESEYQHSQVVFSLWKLKPFEIPNVQNKSANCKWCPNRLQRFIGKVLKYTYQKQTHILHLQLWIRSYDPQKKLIVKLTT